MRGRMSLGIVALLLGSCSPAAGQAVTIQFADGLVTLHAENASIQTILTEWARVGETRIVNADRVSGQMTLELERVPEREALSILLRGASGFIISAREEASNGVSRFGTILIAPAASKTSPSTTSASRDQNARTAASADATGGTILTGGVDGDADDQDSERREIRSQLFGGREVDGQDADGVGDAGARQAAPATTPAKSGAVVGSKKPGVGGP